MMTPDKTKIVPLTLMRLADGGTTNFVNFYEFGQHLYSKLA